MIKNRVSLFITAFLIVGFFFLAMPERGYAGILTAIGCCQFQDGCDVAGNLDECLAFGGQEFFEDEFCIENECVEIRLEATTNVPTLSEWGLIAMASILGIVGFMVIRRRKVTA